MPGWPPTACTAYVCLLAACNCAASSWTSSIITASVVTACTCPAILLHDRWSAEPETVLLHQLPHRPLTRPAKLGDFDFCAPLGTPYPKEMQAQLEVVAAGQMHGLVCWFDLHLCEEESITSGKAWCCCRCSCTLPMLLVDNCLSGPEVSSMPTLVRSTNVGTAAGFACKVPGCMIVVPRGCCFRAAAWLGVLG